MSFSSAQCDGHVAFRRGWCGGRIPTSESTKGRAVNLLDGQETEHHRYGPNYWKNIPCQIEVVVTRGNSGCWYSRQQLNESFVGVFDDSVEVVSCVFGIWCIWTLSLRSVYSIAAICNAACGPSIDTQQHTATWRCEYQYDVSTVEVTALQGKWQMVIGHWS